MKQLLLEHTVVAGTWIVAASDDNEAIQVVGQRCANDRHLLGRLQSGKFIVFTVPGVDLIGEPCLMGYIPAEGGFVPGM